MHPVMRSDFLNGLLFLDRLQRDSCLHFRAEAPPLPRFHFCPVSEAAILHLIDWSEFWGALQEPCRLPYSWRLKKRGVLCSGATWKQGDKECTGHCYRAAHLIRLWRK